MAWASGLYADRAAAGEVSVAVTACAQRPTLLCSWGRILRCTRAVVAATAAGPLFESVLLRRPGLKARSKKNTFVETI